MQLDTLEGGNWLIDIFKDARLKLYLDASSAHNKKVKWSTLHTSKIQYSLKYMQKRQIPRLARLVLV